MEDFAFGIAALAFAVLIAAMSAIAVFVAFMLWRELMVGGF